MANVNKLSKRKITFITTVFNEAATIDVFLKSLFKQSKKPDEIIIVDGGSKDATVKKIKSLIENGKDYKGKFLVYVKKGNRSIGRNEAIKHTTGNIIVCSDSGNILDKDWIKNITEPFHKKNVDVVAGYYKSHAKTLFQKCVVPYALIMEDKVDPKEFLPATRSIAFTKSIWEKIGGFDESLSHNEDYVFARKLKESGAKISFEKSAIVYWLPRNTFREAYVMMYRFALGDAEANILRSKVLLVFARYFLFLYFVFLAILYNSKPLIILLALSIIVYFIWSFAKNYRYIKEKGAIVILPLLQITADAAVLFGTSVGVLKRISRFSLISYSNKNKIFILILLIYVFFLLLTLQWGIPNTNHPFPYHMDEWHQLQAVRATFKYGTPNMAGAANGTMLHFLLSGFYLIPFTLVHYINPAVLKINDLVMRQRVFELLRFDTLGWGILSLFMFYTIAKVLKIPKGLAIFLFVFTPVWLLLSGYFKYDIALMFWILLTLYCILLYSLKPTFRNYLFSGIAAGLAVAIKVSAIPLLIIYIVSYFWFNPKWNKDWKYLFSGTLVYILCVLFFGMPDTIFGKGNIYHYLYENIVSFPDASNYYVLGMNPYLYLLTHHYPFIFGLGLLILLALSSLFLLIGFLSVGIQKSFVLYKTELFIFFSFLVFVISLIPLKVFAGGNRSLVLLPFMVLICGFAIQKAIKLPFLKLATILLIIITVLVQSYTSFAWAYTKIAIDPQEASSDWLATHIQPRQLLGLENIPIYQNIPDILQKEFYYDQYKIKNNNRFTYEIVDSTTKKLPPLVVITNGEVESKVLPTSPKKSLLQRLAKENYKKIAEFRPSLQYTHISDKDYYFSWILSAPLTIAVYKK